MQKVPLGALWDKDQRRRFSSSTTSWIAFQALLQRCRQSAAGAVGVEAVSFFPAGVPGWSA
eukprot:4235231-Pyramimonas_sp.AAC.1